MVVRLINSPRLVRPASKSASHCRDAVVSCQKRVGSGTSAATAAINVLGGARWRVPAGNRTRIGGLGNLCSIR
jgi:hypothetical protein